MKKRLSFLILSIVLFSCSKNEKEECVFTPDVSSKAEFKFEQFQDSLTSIKSKPELVQLLSRQPLIRDYIFRRTSYPNDSVFINEIYRRLNNQGVDTLMMQTREVFGDLSELKSELTQAFSNLQYYYPEFVPPKVQTVISGLDTDLFVSDSLIIISLDFFLGPKAKYRPKVYDYLLRQYNKENIVPSIMLIYGIGNEFNNTDLKDKTVLADMIAYGKAYYFAKHMLPCVPDSIFIWYTRDEIEGSRKNQDLIWMRFVQDQVIFSTSHMTKQKYLGERPKTLEVGEKCPGRIGQWIGWQIVNSYMNSNQKITIPELMHEENAQKIFKESKYKPRKK